MKILLLLPLLLGFSVPAIAHNEANGGSNYTLFKNIKTGEIVIDKLTPVGGKEKEPHLNKQKPPTQES